MTNFTKISKTFDHWLANLDEVSGWLYVSEKVSELRKDTLCHNICISNDISLEEQNDSEIEISNSGLIDVFERADIEMVISNLHQQVPSFSQEQCLEALNYYWKNNAYQNVAA